ncbi:nucleoside phosphorylase domain-containing protein [Xylariales sp. PMI_506]|nr:nucleoside phosphorylase domain-containing protein [Xylariales sp. PMI_506]
MTTHSHARPRSRGDFEIAIICALPLEADAMSLIFDEFWDEDGDSFGRAIGDCNVHTTGRIGRHDVVLICLPGMGKASAAGATANLCASYTAVRIVLLVGICGGVPGSTGSDEMILGDVMISKRVVQYDFGGHYPGQFITKDTSEDALSQPNREIRGLLVVFEGEHGRELLQRKAGEYLLQIQQAAAAKGRQTTYQYPGEDHGQLFRPDYIHRHRNETNCDCSNGPPACKAALAASCHELQCDTDYVISRLRLA